MMRTGDYLRILRDSWLIVLVCTIAFTGVAVLFTPEPSPEYQATATLAVSTCVALERSVECDPIRGTGFAIQRSQIYSTLGTTLPVLNRAIALVDFPVNVEDLRIGTVVTSEPNSPLIEVQVLWPVAKDSVILTNAVARALIDYADDTIDSIPEQAGSTEFFFAEEATQPIEQSPASVSIVAVALVLGLTIGLSIAVFRYALDRRLRSPFEAENVTGLDVLANVPIVPFVLKRRNSRTSGSETVDDIFRRLRVGVLVRTDSLRARTLLIASSQPGESAAAIAEGLAESIAETGARVLLVNIDASGASAAVDHQLASGREALSLESAAPSISFHQLGSSSMHVLSTGSAQSLNPVVLGAAMVEKLESFDYVLISAPPLLPTADAVALIPSSDAVLLVVGIGVVHRDDLRASLRSVALSGGTPIGVATTISGSPRKAITVR